MPDSGDECLHEDYDCLGLWKAVCFDCRRVSDWRYPEAGWLTLREWVGQ